MWAQVGEWSHNSGRVISQSCASHLETLSYGDVLHSLKPLHIQHELHRGPADHRLHQWAELEVKITLFFCSSPWGTQTQPRTPSAFTVWLCWVVEDTGIHSLWGGIVYSTQICNFKLLEEDKVLITALCNVITPSLSVIKKLILTVLFTISFTLLDILCC